MSASIKKDGCSIIAVDSSPAMINKCKANVENKTLNVPIEYLCRDVCDVKIKNVSVVVMNFILQFILHEKKESVLKNIYKGLNPKGVLILSEKIRFYDKKENDFHVDQYNDFKHANGYSELEIQQKQQALLNVLKLDTLDIHIKRLSDIGFSNISIWYQHFNFASIIAIKK
jgi:tRNA (cmo5U34)-methyltransferase